MHNSGEKLWQATANSLYEKFLRGPEGDIVGGGVGGKGKGPEAFRGPLAFPPLKLAMVFKATAI